MLLKKTRQITKKFWKHYPQQFFEIRNRDFLIITWGGKEVQASNFKANFAYLSKKIMISDVVVVNARTKTEIGVINYCAQCSGGKFAIFISKKKSHGIIVFL